MSFYGLVISVAVMLCLIQVAYVASEFQYLAVISTAYNQMSSAMSVNLQNSGAKPLISTIAVQ